MQDSQTVWKILQQYGRLLNSMEKSHTPRLSNSMKDSPAVTIIPRQLQHLPFTVLGKP